MEDLEAAMAKTKVIHILFKRCYLSLKSENQPQQPQIIR